MAFPPSRFLIEIGDVTCKPKDGQGVCNEFVAVEDIFLVSVCVCVASHCIALYHSAFYRIA
jgi:hypothetical protein